MPAEARLRVIKVLDTLAAAVVRDRLLVLPDTDRDAHARIISSREASRQERKEYENA